MPNLNALGRFNSMATSAEKATLQKQENNLECRKICIALETQIKKRICLAYKESNQTVPARLLSKSTAQFGLNTLEGHLRKVTVIASPESFQAWRFNLPPPTIAFGKRPMEGGSESGSRKSPSKSPREPQAPEPDSDDSDCQITGP